MIMPGFTQQAGNKFDKEDLLKYFEQTYQQISETVAGLNSKQLHFKPSDNQWSVSQCLYHIVLTEGELMEYVYEAMKQPEKPYLRDSIKISDNDIRGFVTDRSFKASAQNDLKNTVTYNTVEEALAKLLASRKKIKEYINSLPEESFRNHIVQWPSGYFDSLQTLLFIAGHSERHLLQIKEVIADKNFPQ